MHIRIFAVNPVMAQRLKRRETELILEKQTPMKTISTFLIALFAIAATYAQNNNLVVFSENGERFYLVLNGIRQNAKPETNVKVTGLNAQNYKAKIIFESQGLPDYNQNIYLMSSAEQGKNMEYTYILRKKKDSYKLTWMSEAPINVDAAPAANQTVVVHTTTEPVPAPPVNNSATTTTTTTTTTTAPATTTTTTGTGTSENVSIGMNVNGMGVNMNVNINDGTGMTGTSTTTTSSSTTYSSTVTTSSSGTGTYTEPAPSSTTTTTTTTSSACVNPMGSSDFAEAKKSIASKSFEDSKITMAKQIIKANCLSTAQVKEIMMLFSFEDTKLDLAKFAYNRTTDPNNYYKLNDAFTFESSIEELDKYVESQKK